MQELAIRNAQSKINRLRQSVRESEYLCKTRRNKGREMRRDESSGYGGEALEADAEKRRRGRFVRLGR